MEEQGYRGFPQEMKDIIINTLNPFKEDIPSIDEMAKNYVNKTSDYYELYDEATPDLIKEWTKLDFIEGTKAILSLPIETIIKLKNSM